MSTPAPDSTSTSERIAAAFTKLKASAKNINGVAERVNQQIHALETCLENINVGVACWTQFAGDRTQYEYWSHSVGYAYLNGRWCIAIRTVEGADWREEDTIGEWPFAKAPRYLQPKAIEKLPDLIESMVAATDAAAGRLEEKIAPTEEIVSTIQAIAFPKKK